MQIELYKKILVKQQISQHYSKSSLNNTLMQLRKVCNHPYLFEGVEDESLPTLGEHLITVSGKMMVLDKILGRLPAGRQALIFSQFTTVLDILEDYLAYRDREYCRIDGSTYIEDRER